MAKGAASVYVNDEDTKKFDDVCYIAGVSRPKAMSIMINRAYDRLVLGFQDQDVNELAERHGVGHGTILDLLDMEDI